MQARVTVVAMCLAVTACAARRPSTRTVWLPSYALGAIGGGDLDIRDVCSSGAVDELSVGSTWATLGVSVATLGVYTPREARIKCAASR